MNRNVCWVPPEQYDMIRRTQKNKADVAPPESIDPLLVGFILLIVLGVAALLGLFTSKATTDPISAAPAPDDDLIALLDDTDSQAMASGNASWVQEEKQKKIAAVTSSAPARFVINTYKSMGQNPNLLPPAVITSQKQSPAPVAAAMVPPITNTLSQTQSHTSPPVQEQQQVEPAAALLPPAPHVVIEQVIEEGPPPAPEVTIDSLYVDWPVLLPNYMLTQHHPFQDWCQRIMRVNYGEASAVLGVVVGPRVTDMEDSSYLRFRDDVRQKLIDFFAEREPNGKYQYYAPSYQRVYHGRNIQFMRAYSADSRILGLVATVVQSDGRAYAYLFDGHAGFYGTFLNTIGEAYVIDSSTWE